MTLEQEQNAKKSFRNLSIDWLDWKSGVHEPLIDVSTSR